MSKALSPSAPQNGLPEGQITDFEALLQKVGRGDQSAFIALFEYFAPRVKSFLLKGGLNDDTADELAQDTLLAVWQKAGQYNPARARASTWIYTIARNKKIDFLRKKAPLAVDPATLILADENQIHPIEELSRIREDKQIHEALRELSDEQRVMIDKAFFEGHTHAQIARETGIPLGTVKSRIRQALEKMRGLSNLQTIRREERS